MEERNPYCNDAAANKGFIACSAHTNRSITVDMICGIHSDLFFQDKFILSDVSMRIRLIRNKDAFCLMAAAGSTFKVKILDCKLYVRKVKISPSVFIAHNKALEGGNAKYPIRRAVCKTYTIPAGNLNQTQENLFTGQLPTRIVIGCVDNDAFNGRYVKNPYNFKNYDLNQLKVYLDGQQHSVIPIEPNFTTNNYITAYANLFAGTGKLMKDEGTAIRREDFRAGYVLYAFDLTADLAEEGHFNLMKHGNVRLDLKFGTALTVTINVFAYAEFESVLEIDKSSEHHHRLQKLKMLTSTIKRYLTRHCRGQFMGGFSSDTLPTRIKKRPAIIVCNTDSSDRGGEHWICIYIDKNGHGEFFDSFGRRPCQPFCGFLNKHCLHWTYNDRQLQNIFSTVCGSYCVIFTIYKSYGHDMHRIVACFHR